MQFDRAPLHWAVMKGHLEVVTELIAANADVKAIDTVSKFSLASYFSSIYVNYQLRLHLNL